MNPATPRAKSILLMAALASRPEPSGERMKSRRYGPLGQQNQEVVAD
jgi:hypothetical protein